MIIVIRETEITIFVVTKLLSLTSFGRAVWKLDSSDGIWVPTMTSTMARFQIPTYVVLCHENLINPAITQHLNVRRNIYLLIRFLCTEILQNCQENDKLYCHFKDTEYQTISSDENVSVETNEIEDCSKSDNVVIVPNVENCLMHINKIKCLRK